MASLLMMDTVASEGSAIVRCKPSACCFVGRRHHRCGSRSCCPPLALQTRSRTWLLVTTFFFRSSRNYFEPQRVLGLRDEEAAADLKHLKEEILIVHQTQEVGSLVSASLAFLSPDIRKIGVDNAHPLLGVLVWSESANLDPMAAFGPRTLLIHSTPSLLRHSGPKRERLLKFQKKGSRTNRCVWGEISPLS